MMAKMILAWAPQNLRSALLLAVYFARVYPTFLIRKKRTFIFGFSLHHTYIHKHAHRDGSVTVKNGDLHSADLSPAATTIDNTTRTGAISVSARVPVHRARRCIGWSPDDADEPGSARHPPTPLATTTREQQLRRRGWKTSKGDVTV